MALHARKIPFYLTVFFLTLGASLIVALLSFGGMWAFMLDLGIKWSTAALLTGSLTAAFFSGVFELEIYWQNTKKGWGKIVNGDYLRDFFAAKFFKKFYLNNAAKDNEAEKPQFLKDYDICTKQLSTLKKLKQELSNQIKDAMARKASIAEYEDKLAAHKATEKKVLKNQKALKKIFAQVLFSKSITQSDKANAYKNQLKTWLEKDPRATKHQNIYKKLEKRQHRYFWAKIFSVVSSIASGIGTLFLLSSIFETVPAIALFAGPLLASPVGIILMSLVAGAAYGMLIFNSITDMMDNKTIQKWYKNFFKEDGLKFKEEKYATAKKVAMWILGATFVVLAGFISVCTAGTWWMATKNLPGFLSFVKGAPARVIYALRLTISVVIGLATLIFDLENTSQSLEILRKGLDGEFYKKYQKIKGDFNTLWDSEWTIEKLNPFRALLIVTVVVVQVVLFFGHLVCMGVDSDQTPWDISERFLTFWSSILEFATDLHYVADKFGGHNHDANEPCHGHGAPGHAHAHGDHEANALEEEKDDHGHEHHIDIPKIVAMTIAHALFWVPAMIWSEVFGRIRCYCLKSRANAKAEAEAENPGAVAAADVSGALPAPISAPVLTPSVGLDREGERVQTQTYALSQEGQAEVACYRMQKKSNHHINSWFGSTAKAIAIDRHQGFIREEIKNDILLRTKNVEEILDETCNDKAISAHRGFGFFCNKNADTYNDIKGIKEQVSVQVSTAAAAAA